MIHPIKHFVDTPNIRQLCDRFGDHFYNFHSDDEFERVPALLELMGFLNAYIADRLRANTGLNFSDWVVHQSDRNHGTLPIYDHVGEAIDMVDSDNAQDLVRLSQALANITADTMGRIWQSWPEQAEEDDSFADLFN